MPAVRDLIQVSLLADLRAQPVYPGARALMVGKLAIDDGMGGFYRWDESSAAAEDSAFLNVIASAVTPAGRWVRVFQRARQLPQGVLVNNGGVKTLYAAGATTAQGDCTLYLTADNTPTGPALFAEVWENSSRANTPATGPSTAVSSYTMSLSADLKATRHGYYRANAATVTLGLVYAPLAAAPAGIPVQSQITGV